MNLGFLIRQKALVPRLRGQFLGMRFGNISSRTMIYRQLRFTRRFVEIAPECVIYKNCRIEGVDDYEGQKLSPSLKLGRGVRIQQNCHITFGERISIGAGTSLAANVTVTDIDHPYEDLDIPVENQPLRTCPVEIGEGGMVYNNAVILPGTRIGNHCVVGANSVVKGEFPDNCIIAGIPARIVKRYNPECGKWEPARNKPQ